MKAPLSVRNARELRRRLEERVMAEADVLLSTLASSTGRETERLMTSTNTRTCRCRCGSWRRAEFFPGGGEGEGSPAARGGERDGRGGHAPLHPGLLQREGE